MGNVGMLTPRVPSGPHPLSPWRKELVCGYTWALRKGFLGTDWMPRESHQLQGKECWLQIRRAESH